MNSKQENTIIKKSFFSYILLFLLIVPAPKMFADDIDDFLNIPGGGQDPAGFIDTPFFWALLLILGTYIAYRKLQPKTT